MLFLHLRCLLLRFRFCYASAYIAAIEASFSMLPSPRLFVCFVTSAHREITYAASFSRYVAAAFAALPLSPRAMPPPAASYAATASDAFFAFTPRCRAGAPRRHTRASAQPPLRHTRHDVCATRRAALLAERR